MFEDMLDILKKENPSVVE
jgi:hypothetical protein